jgi:hypothetical protein
MVLFRVCSTSCQQSLLPGGLVRKGLSPSWSSDDVARHCMPSLHPFQNELTDSLEERWCQLGGVSSLSESHCCRLVDHSLLLEGPALHLLAHSPAGNGILACLCAVLRGCPDLEARFGELHVTAAERCGLPLLQCTLHALGMAAQAGRQAGQAVIKR